MGCCHYYAPSAGGDTAFSIDISAITFGLGVLSELGDHARARGIERVALMTDKVLGGVGYGEADIPALTVGAYPQRRRLDNAPRAIGKDELNGLFRDALAYW